MALRTFRRPPPKFMTGSPRPGSWPNTGPPVFLPKPLGRDDMKQARFTSSFLCAAVLASGALGVRTLAQLPANATVYASGLEGPRGLAFGTDGSLYIAEAGLGGKTSTVGTCQQTPAPVGPYTGVLTARISKVDTKGDRTTVVSGLPSAV